MKKVIVSKEYFIPESVEEFKEKFDYEQYIEDNITDYPYDISWSEDLLNKFDSIFDAFGISDSELDWDVSYSQGSGASFTGTFDIDDFKYDNNKILKEHFPDDNELLTIFDALYDIVDKTSCIAKITRCRNMHYVHSNTMCVDSNISVQIDKELLIVFMELADWMHVELQTEYGRITSGDYIINMIVDNEYKIPEEYLKESNEKDKK